MQKALTKEDLIYILSNIFKASTAENNAFQVLDDGLYVLDFNTHANDINVHVDAIIKAILNKITVDDNNNLIYDNKILGTISSKENNAIIQEPDGFFVNDLTQTVTDHHDNNDIHVTQAWKDSVQEHIEDSDIHVTQEDKDKWNSDLQNANDYTNESINNLTLHDFVIVDSMEDLPSLEDASPTTLYIVKHTSEDFPELTAIPYIYDDGIIRQLTIGDYAIQNKLNDILLAIESQYVKQEQYHNHDNLDTLKRFTNDENGNLLYDNKNIFNVTVSELEKNAISVDENGKLYVKDFEKEIKEIQIEAALAKIQLYDTEIKECGTYILNEPIENFNFIYIDYYYVPSEQEDAIPSNAKSVMIDTDTLNDYHVMGVDYMLELGYGVSVANAKISAYTNQFILNYNHNICIYKITGIRKGVTENE